MMGLADNKVLKDSDAALFAGSPSGRWESEFVALFDLLGRGVN